MKTLALTATLVLFGACTSSEKGASGGPPPALSPPRSAPSIQPASAQPQAPVPAAPREPSPAESVSAYPVRWSEQLGGAEADLSKQLTATGGIYGELSRGDKTEMPKSCSDWERLHAAGYEPSTAIEVQPDIAAKSRCLALKILQRAQPASRSFVRELRLTPKSVSILPAALAASVAPEDEARVQAGAAAGHSLKQLDPKLKAKKGAVPDSLEITAGDGQSYLLLEALAWGDFNSDGLDDVLLSVTNGVSQGSLLSARVMTLTRDDEGAVLRVIDVR